MSASKEPADFEDFFYKVSHDGNLNYLLQDYPEIIECFRMIGTLNEKHMFQILLAAEKDTMRLTDVIEHIKDQRAGLMKELEKKDQQILILKQRLVPASPIEYVTLGASRNKDRSEAYQIRKLRKLLDLPSDCEDLFEGFEDRIEELKFRKESEPVSIRSIHSDGQEKDLYLLRIRELNDENLQLVHSVNQLEMKLKSNEKSFADEGEKQAEIKTRKKKRVFLEFTIRKNLERLKMDMNILRDEALRSQNFVELYVDKIRRTLPDLIGFRNLEDTFRIPERRMETKPSTYGDARQLHFDVFDNTRSTKLNTKKMHSQPLDLEDLRKSLNMLSTKHNTELKKFFDFAKTYFLGDKLHSMDFNPNKQAEVLLMRTKIKALRDEFTSRQGKIYELNKKIKDLSLFKLEIETEIRGVLQDNFSILKSENIDLKLRLLIKAIKKPIKRYYQEFIVKSLTNT